jgi:hypothetical protein
VPSRSIEPGWCSPHLGGQPKVGNGSGGPFAEVIWTRGEQYLELHVRVALGIVIYGLTRVTESAMYI